MTLPSTFEEGLGQNESDTRKASEKKTCYSPRKTANHLDIKHNNEEKKRMSELMEKCKKYSESGSGFSIAKPSVRVDIGTSRKMSASSVLQKWNLGEGYSGIKQGSRSFDTK